MEDLSNYEKLREDSQKFYNSVSKIFSPALSQEICFSAEGFNHIIFKGSRSEREKSSQILRFKLLPLAIKLVRLSTTFQDFEESLKEVDFKSFKKRVRKTKVVKYWGIIAIIDTRKIKVIIRKIGDGSAHFWSIIPDWATSSYRDIKMFPTMKGNPDED